MENIKPDQQERLIQDLREKTGLDIRKTSIEEIDLIKNKVVIKIYLQFQGKKYFASWTGQSSWKIPINKSNILLESISMLSAGKFE